MGKLREGRENEKKTKKRTEIEFLSFLMAFKARLSSYFFTSSYLAFSCIRCASYLHFSIEYSVFFCRDDLLCKRGKRKEILSSFPHFASHFVHIFRGETAVRLKKIRQ